MFSALTIELDRNIKKNLSFEDSQFVHAAFLNLITEVNPEAGKNFHTASRYRPFTTSILKSEHGSNCIRLTLIDLPNLLWAERFIDEVYSLSSIRIGQGKYPVLGVTLTGSPWTGFSSWGDFFIESPSKKIRLSLSTPTAIMKLDSVGKRTTSLLEKSVDVFSGLLRRWRAMGGPNFELDFEGILDATNNIIETRNLRTMKYEFPERAQTGVVGSLDYDCKVIETKEFNCLCALARFAFYVGIGYQTARGMGCTRVSFIS